MVRRHSILLALSGPRVDTKTSAVVRDINPKWYVRYIILIRSYRYKGKKSYEEKLNSARTAAVVYDHTRLLKVGLLCDGECAANNSCVYLL